MSRKPRKPRYRWFESHGAWVLQSSYSWTMPPWNYPVFLKAPW